MPITATEGIDVGPGNYTGTVANTSIRPATDKSGKPLGYDYLRIEIATEVPGKEEAQLVPYDVPARLSPATKLGKLLKALDMPIPKKGESWDEKTLHDTRVRLSIENDPENPQFVRVVDDSITLA